MSGDHIIKLAKQVGMDVFDDDVCDCGVVELEAFYRAAFNAGLEAAANVRAELDACQKERDKMKEWAVALEGALLESDKAAWEESIAKAISEETK